ncbi:hypothetical protein AMTR_s00022p00184470 [Amborella trichopoda]|uniref:Uncharacterized protein n=1 Tax=Amborella trichopoda TaxID=13333 RepID=W1PU57_AMBTC|nr:hypothetical protein AMTR_s00022p00184470 [Amborella trichopoda]
MDPSERISWFGIDPYESYQISDTKKGEGHGPGKGKEKGKGKGKKHRDLLDPKHRERGRKWLKKGEREGEGKEEDINEAEDNDLKGRRGCKLKEDNGRRFSCGGG